MLPVAADAYGDSIAWVIGPAIDQRNDVMDLPPLGAISIRARDADWAQTGVNGPQIADVLGRQPGPRAGRRARLALEVGGVLGLDGSPVRRAQSDGIEAAIVADAVIASAHLRA